MYKVLLARNNLKTKFKKIKCCINNEIYDEFKF